MAYEINEQTKQQLNHLGEVVTGKTNGAPTGSDIAASTLPYTGQVRRTIPEIERLALESFRLGAGNKQGDYAIGVAFEEANWTYTYNGQQWGLSSTFDLSTLPYTATQADPNNDSNLEARGEASNEYVDTEIANLETSLQGEIATSQSTLRGEITDAQEELLPPGSQIYPESGTLANAMTVTAGTTHLRVLVDGKPTIVAMYPVASGVVADLTEDSAAIGGVQIQFINLNNYNLTVKSFGAKSDGVTVDTDAVVAMINAVGYAKITADTVCGTITMSAMSSTDLIFFGENTARLISPGGVFLELDADIGDLIITNLTLDGYEKCSNVVDGSGLSLSRVRIQDNLIINCGSGFEIDYEFIQDAVVTGNFFKGMTRNGIVTGIHLGLGTEVNQSLRGDYVVANNTFKDLESTGTSETHAIFLFGDRATITGNSIDTVRNAANTAAEAIYTKCRYVTCTGNTIKDGGYSSNGAIAIKGRGRDEMGAAFGYNVTCIGNVIYYTPHSGQEAMGIYIQNDNVTCIGNIIENASLGDIVIPGTNPDSGPIVVTGNISYGSTSERCIEVTGPVKSMNVSNNNLYNIKGIDAAICYGILINVNSTYDLAERVSICNNTITVDGTNTATREVGIAVDAGNTELVKTISLVNNIIDTKAAVTGEGIRLISLGGVENIVVTDNIVEADLNHFYIGSGVSFTGSSVINSNIFSGLKLNQSPNLSYADNGQPDIRSDNVESFASLPPAKVGLNFKRIRSFEGATSNIGFDLNSGSFRGTAESRVSIQTSGVIAVECFEDGIWDVVQATSAIVYSS